MCNTTIMEVEQQQAAILVGDVVGKLAARDVAVFPPYYAAKPNNRSKQHVTYKRSYLVIWYRKKDIGQATKRRALCLTF